MAIVSFNFIRMNAERQSTIRGRLNINNNITIKDVRNADLAFGKAQESALRFTFEFLSSYEPKAGEILIVGELIDMLPEAEVKDIIDAWQRNKRVPQGAMARILPTILNRCNIQALILSRDINLPPPIPMPRVNVQETQQGLPAGTHTVVKKPKKK
ncbi:MAG TPA: hypothetical protein VJK52_06030 [Candidatus Nanoarchaeia archaeon]|nr:hypothetical protein [Candidatus Nanoarchaeia archaeon]